MFSKLIKALKRDGLRYMVIRLLAKLLGEEIGIQRTKTTAWNILKARYGYTVAYGPFKGMQLAEDVWWSKNDRTTQLLGIYEERVFTKLRYFAQHGAKTFIDIGAADGYFAVGMAYSGIYKNVFAFEIEERGRESIKENSVKNGCSGLVHVSGEACFESINGLIDKEQMKELLIDIEGGAYDFLSEEMLALLFGSFVICELHPFLIEDGVAAQNNLLERASTKFQTELIMRESYSPNSFSELSDLSDEERLIAVGEERAKNMQWLVLTPLQTEHVGTDT